MRIESHLRNLKESLEEINEAVQVGLQNRQRSLGFHTSAASADMIEISLHKKKLIDPGFVIKHEWLKSEKLINSKLNFNFQSKQEILELARKIELERNKLCYGSLQPEPILEKVLSDFSKLKEIFKEEINEIQ